jgi:hypothetical protein
MFTCHRSALRKCRINYSLEQTPARLTMIRCWAQIDGPPKALDFNGELRMSDKLFIDLWGATISADGVYAIIAAVIIIFFLMQRRL